MGGKTVPQGVHRHMLAQTGRDASRPASGVQNGRLERSLAIATGKQPARRSSESPIGPKDLEKLRREHHVTIPAALTLFDPDHHPLAIDISDLEENDLRDAQPGGVDRRQCGAALDSGSPPKSSPPRRR